jgi:hypothetical protein
MKHDHDIEIPVGTHCEWCGAEFEESGPPRVRKVRVPTPKPAAPQEPQTHCEWCGAPYPEPEEGKARSG